jgi:hypothetical protein
MGIYLWNMITDENEMEVMGDFIILILKFVIWVVFPFILIFSLYDYVTGKLRIKKLQRIILEMGRFRPDTEEERVLYDTINTLSVEIKLEERKNEEFWFGLDGFGTESELDEVFLNLGYKTNWETRKQLSEERRTPIGGDEVLEHILDEEIVVQIKNQKRKTSRPDLQKFRGSMKDYEKGIFVSINGFTNTCEKFVQTSDRQILLYDVNDVIGMSEGNKPKWNENEE